MTHRPFNKITNLFTSGFCNDDLVHQNSGMTAANYCILLHCFHCSFSVNLQILRKFNWSYCWAIQLAVQLEVLNYVFIVLLCFASRSCRWPSRTWPHVPPTCQVVCNIKVRSEISQSCTGKEGCTKISLFTQSLSLCRYQPHWVTQHNKSIHITKHKVEFARTMALWRWNSTKIS